MEELLRKLLEKAEVAVATEPRKGHIAYTRTVGGKTVKIPQKGSVLKEREEEKKKPEDVMGAEDHGRFKELLDNYFKTSDKVYDLASQIEKAKGQMEESMSSIRPILTKFENLEKAESKFRAEFKEDDWHYKFLSFTKESKPYKDLYTKAFNMLSDMQQTELKTAEEALKRITSQETFKREQVAKAVALMKEYVGKPFSNDLISSFRRDVLGLILLKAKAEAEDKEYEDDKEESSSKETVDDKKYKKDKGDKDKDDIKKKPKKEKKEGKDSKGEAAKKLSQALENLVGLKERGNKLLAELFGRAKKGDKEKKQIPKNEKKGKEEKEKRKSLIDLVMPMIEQRTMQLNDELMKAREHKYIKRLGVPGSYEYVYGQPGFTREELKKRTEIRKLQDKVVSKLIRMGYKLDDRLKGYSRPDGYFLTVRDLKDYIFPGFKENFKTFVGVLGTLATGTRDFEKARPHKYIKRLGAKGQYEYIYAEKPGAKKILYSPDLNITNLEQLPRGTGARYLEVIQGEGDKLVAKRWRRNPVWPEGSILIDMGERLGVKEPPGAYEYLSVKRSPEPQQRKVYRDIGEKIAGPSEPAYGDVAELLGGMRGRITDATGNSVKIGYGAGKIAILNKEDLSGDWEKRQHGEGWIWFAEEEPQLVEKATGGFRLARPKLGEEERESGRKRRKREGESTPSIERFKERSRERNA